MENEILVVAKDKVVLGFINSSGEIEYTVYEAKDGGVIEVADESKLGSIGAILALEAGSTEYQDYTLKEIE